MRIAYWTSGFEPEIEAVSAEVALLRRRFTSSIAWGLSHRRWALLSWRRGFCLHPRMQFAFRVLTRLLEPAFQLNHVFGSLDDWLYLEGPRRRPTVLTMATAGVPIDRSLLDRVDRFVTEFPAGRQQLTSLGIEPDRIRLIFPPADLHRFMPRPKPDGRFTVLFASSPEKESWLQARGVPQILDAASMRPQMKFRLLWRPWGDSACRVREWIHERGLSNVDLVVGVSPDVPGEYNRSHVTIAPFTDPERSKAAPNSLVESLACGRPVVTTESVGLADVVREQHAGLVCAADGLAIAESLDRIQSQWQEFSGRARALAERFFGLCKFLEGYERLYGELVPRRSRAKSALNG